MRRARWLSDTFAMLVSLVSINEFNVRNCERKSHMANTFTWKINTNREIISDKLLWELQKTEARLINFTSSLEVLSNKLITEL